MPWRGQSAVLDVGSGASRRIFISYRRDDTEGHVLALAPPLRARFGEDRIFKDTDSIHAGDDFVQAIQQELASCSVMLVVIGRSWLSIQEPHLRSRRLDNPKDLLRLEVASALEGKRVRVIPVLVGGATLPAPEDLPSNLRSLARLQKFTLRGDRWDADIEALIAEIEAADAKISSGSLGSRPWFRRGVQAATAVMLAALVVFWMWERSADRTVSPPQEGFTTDDSTPPPKPVPETDKAEPPNVPLKPPPEKPSAAKPSAEKPSAEKSPVEKSPVEKPPVEKPPVEKPPVEGTRPQRPTPPPNDADERSRAESFRKTAEAAIRQTLERFRVAYSEKNADALRDVFPQVQADRLFGNLEVCARASLVFTAMKIELISATQALVDVEALYGCQPRTGQREQVSKPVRDTFRLVQHGTSWVIERRQITLDEG